MENDAIVSIDEIIEKRESRIGEYPDLYRQDKVNEAIGSMSDCIQECGLNLLEAHNALKAMMHAVDACIVANADDMAKASELLARDI